ncbi:hypothetical protein [Anabaena azotica]|uniref:Uncharacterized protein n=1 Tax=Anabaena azotica FACHB-119 TaxID=947527 RepID=A0ABR8DEE2_9NOST|nr:hypothetical protein [Anabaena azotica]MBD2505605.1 hypothetical protein [Anabaena azotica FACHB-119]
MRISARLIRSQDNVVVEADLVKLTQKHTSDYNSQWKEQLKLSGQAIP